jgi:formylglycine-generating enzyme required for sulfatase activity
MVTYSYDNLDLEIRRAADGYVALIRSSREAIEERFALPFATSELACFPLPTGHSRHLRPITPIAPGEQLTPEQFGRRLFDAVFDGKVRDCLVRRLDLIEQRNQESPDQKYGLRIRLNLTDVPDLATLPWEYLCRSDRDYLALSLFTPLVRLLPHEHGWPTLHVQPPLRILVLNANPGGALDAEQEWNNLAASFDAPGAGARVKLDLLSSPSLDLLQETLRHQEYHVLHFIGHGDFDVQAQEGVLLLDRPVSATTLGVQLRDHRPRLVFLNACYSGTGAAADLLAGTAQRLIASGVQAVVAMQSAISDLAAIRLAREFYRSIADGYPLDAALAEGRKALFGSRQQQEWCIPVLFSVAGDMVLLEAQPDSPTLSERPRLSFEPELVSIPAGPFQIGSPDPADVAQGDWELQQVDLPAYAIGKYPVTNAQYAAFVAEKKAHKPEGAGWIGANPPRGQEAYPVVGVSWVDACAYCAWLSAQSGRAYRLPTEAEWVKAARGDQDRRRYPWGDLEPTSERCDLVERRPNPVDRYPLGQSPYGCFDMVGAIYEWTATSWGYDARLMRDGPCGAPYDAARVRAEADAYRVCCGGPLQDRSRRLGCSVRSCFAPTTRAPVIGFRVVQVPQVPSQEC